MRIIGDIHGKVAQYCSIVGDPDCTHSVQIGDFGFRTQYEYRDQFFESENIEGEHVFFGGNHDNYGQLPDWHLGDFGRVPFDDSVYYIRGAMSIDKQNRTSGRDWFPEEELGLRSQLKCKAHLQKVMQSDDAPSVMLSHEAPDCISKKLFDKMVLNTSTGSFLTYVWETYKSNIDLWIFGHWHEAVTQDIEGTTFMCLPELGYVDI